MNRKNAKEIIEEAVQGVLVREVAMTEETLLDGNLGLDSIDRVELIMNLEDNFEVEISDQEAFNIKTIKDALDVLARFGVFEEEDASTTKE